MADAFVSLVLVLGVVLVCESVRKFCKAVFSGPDHSLYLTELLSTFQLCACSQELKLLGDSGRVQPQAGLTLVYVSTVVHVLTFSGALCNPAAALEKLYRGSLRPGVSVALIGCQLTAALLSRYAALYVWSLGLSDLHLSHSSSGFKCPDPINAPLPAAAAVEMSCAFVLQTVLINISAFADSLRVHVVAAVITTLVYAGGSTTGAVMNPALAVSIQFPCSGHTFLEYVFVFWLGPILGVASAVTVFEKIVPSLLTRFSYLKKIQ